MTCCAIGRCDDLDCQVCTVNDRFPESARQVAQQFEHQRALARMTDQERDDYDESLRTKRGRKVKPRKGDLRDGVPTLAGERERPGTASKGRAGMNYRRR